MLLCCLLNKTTEWFMLSKNCHYIDKNTPCLHVIKICSWRIHQNLVRIFYQHSFLSFLLKKNNNIRNNIK